MDNTSFQIEAKSKLRSVEQGATTVEGFRPTTLRAKDITRNVASLKEAFRTGYRSQSAFLPSLHELPSPSEGDQELTELDFSDGKKLVSTYTTEFKKDDILEDPAGNLGNATEVSPIKKTSVFQKFVRNMSRDVMPHYDNYRMRQVETPVRPTLHELCNPQSSSPSVAQDSFTEEPTEKGVEIIVKEENETHMVKFGWIEGVLIRNMMSIWCVILFLRVSWVVGQAGIGEALIIIGISTFITLVTALSLSAITTNGEIGGGGTYFVMSRILGPEFGGSIGIIFTIANAMDCALNVVGFAQTVQDMMKEYGDGLIIFDGGDNDVRIIGTITTIFTCFICGLGSQYETKIKDVMLVIMMISFSNFLAGSIMGPSSELEEAKGFIGYSMDLLKENWGPAYGINEGQLQNFISVFSVYFPACIGILSGANVSGELRVDPNKAIPKGTILAIIYCSIGYAAVAIICGVTMAREATGNVFDLMNGTHLNCTTHECHYGLNHDYQAMSLVSAFGPLNYVGCLAATISCALAEFVSCPALLEVIAADKLYPYWMVGVLGKGYGASKTPYRAFAFTFLLVLAFVLIAKLDHLAILISDFFFATFALMNFSTFHVSLVKPIGWRPTFKYYNTWLSLLTGVLSIVAMILVSLPTAMITIAIVLFFYLVVLYRKPEVNWGSSTQAQTYSAALANIQQLVHIEDHVKNYRPQILVLTGPPSTRPALVDFAYLICKRNSLMICGNIVKERLSAEKRSNLQQKAYRYMRFTNIKGFYSIADNSNLSTGAAALLGIAGVGKVKPNILMMGYKNDWSTCDQNSLEEFVLTIQTGFEMDVAVAILRLQEGFDCSDILGNIDDMILSKNSGEKSTTTQESSNFGSDILVLEESEHQPENSGCSTVLGVSKGKLSKKKQQQSITFRDPEGNELPKCIMNKIILFQKKQKKDTIDVWWLSDDGGLTLLLPVIINSRSNWSETKLRIFCTASGVQELEKEQKGMAVLLSKFRIDYSDLVIISDVNKTPTSKTKGWFENLIRPFLKSNTRGPHITQGELEAFQYKTDRHLRLRELLLAHSADSNLVVMTLPMPRKSTHGVLLYMAWLEALTANMPPFMLVRGNQTSVLTFYV